MDLKKDQYVWHFVSSVIFLALCWLLFLSAERSGVVMPEVSVFEFIVLSFAVFRLIRLFMYDSVMDFVRDFVGKFESGPIKTISNLLSCPWCTGMWMSYATVFIYLIVPHGWYFIMILALGGLGSFFQKLVNRI